MESLHRALVRKLGANGAGLISALNTIFRSIGYDLLAGYRNWVTHRGAPIVVGTETIVGVPLPVPGEMAAMTDQTEFEFRLKSHVYELVSETIRIRCWAFVPPVQLAYSATVAEATEDTVLPGGIMIGKGAKNITIKNARVVAGDLSEDAEIYRSKNPTALETARIRFADEDLAEYSVVDYLQAVRHVVHFVDRSLSRNFDPVFRDSLAV